MADPAAMKVIVAAIQGCEKKNTPIPKAIRPQNLVNKIMDTANKNQLLLTGLGLAAAATGYIGYAIYLDCKINSSSRFWHWTAHHIKDGYIDSLELLEMIHAHYAHLQEIHPLTAVFAATHDVEQEIQDCLKLRGMIQTLGTCKLSGLISEGVTNLDRKLENLYLLKIALANCTAETRSRCKKKAALIL
jgi:hypothetical protein